MLYVLPGVAEADSGTKNVIKTKRTKKVLMLFLIQIIVAQLAIEKRAACATMQTTRSNSRRTEVSWEEPSPYRIRRYGSSRFLPLHLEQGP